MTEPLATLEFSDPEHLPWSQIGSGAWEKILYRDEMGGSYVRMLRFAPGFITSEQPMVHDFDEVVHILDGGVANVNRPEERYTRGMYAVFPARTEHGPFISEGGALFIEFRHYTRQP